MRLKDNISLNHQHYNSTVQVNRSRCILIHSFKQRYFPKHVPVIGLSGEICLCCKQDKIYMVDTAVYIHYKVYRSCQRVDCNAQ